MWFCEESFNYIWSVFHKHMFVVESEYDMVCKRVLFGM